MLCPQADLYRHIAPRVRQQKVFEVGFGTGFGTLQLAAEASSVCATEIDREALAFAQQNLPLPNVVWWDAGYTLMHLPFDAVVMVEVLEHVSDRYLALKNVHNALVRGGTLYVTARNAAADLRRNELHNDEKTAAEFLAELAPFFRAVSIYDSSLTQRLTETSHVTPTIAV